MEIIFWSAAILGYLFLLGLYLSAFSDLPLSDPAGYPGFAKASRYFFDSGGREPLQIFLVKIALKIIADEKLALRLLSLLATQAAFIAAVIWCRWVWGFWAAAAAALALAQNRIAGFYSTTGYNMVTYSFFVLLWFLIFLHPQPTKRKALALGITGGLASLTRLEGLLAVCLAHAVWAWPWKKNWHPLALALGLTWGITAPYLLTQKLTTGHFLSSHTPHAGFWRVRQAPASPKPNQHPEASWHSLWTQQGLGPALSQTTKGFVLGFFSYLPRLWQGASWAAALALAGLFFLWRHGNRKILLVFACFIAPVAIILPLDQIKPGSGAELRFALPLLWPTALLAGYGLSSILNHFFKMTLIEKKEDPHNA